MPETITSTVTTPTGLGGGMGRGMQGPPEMMGWMQPPPGVMFGQGTPAFSLTIIQCFYYACIVLHHFKCV